MCTCMDFILHSTVCNHIHLVEMYKVGTSGENESSQAIEAPGLANTNSSSSPCVKNRETIEEPDVSSLQYLSKCLVSSKSDHVASTEKAVSLCKQIEAALLECTSSDAIKRGTKHLTAALTVIRSVETVRNRTTDHVFLLGKDLPLIRMLKSKFVSSLRKRSVYLQSHHCQNQMNSKEGSV